MKKTFMTLFSVLVVIIIVLGIILYQALNPYSIAREDSYEYAVEHTEFEELDEFYTYNGTEGTYFTVAGTGELGNYLVVIIEQDTGNIDIFNQNEIISEYDAAQVFQQAKPDSTIEQLRIGKDEGIPIWEVTYRLPNGAMGYYTMDLQTGEMIKVIENL